MGVESTVGRRRRKIVLLLLSLLLRHGACLSVVPSYQKVYSTAATIQMTVSGELSADLSDLDLRFEPSLDGVCDVEMQDATTLLLRLRPSARWPVTSVTQWTSLKVTYLADPTSSFEGEVAIAQIRDAPVVTAHEDKVVFMSSSLFLSLEGHALLKDSEFTFDPPLRQNRDYSVVAVTAQRTTLRLLRQWRSDGLPGPLRLLAVDSGAGDLAVDVQVASVQLDPLSDATITVDSPRETTFYDSATSLTVTGSSGLNDVAKFYFASESPDRDFYSLQSTSATNAVVLCLREGEPWRSSGVYPGSLVLLAVDAGDGPVPVSTYGTSLGTVLETPTVNSAEKRVLYRTFTRDLWITGTGFTSGDSLKTQLAFSPSPFMQDYDYTITVRNATHLQVKLQDGRAWPSTGALTVIAIDTGAGSVKDFLSVVVAQIQKDPSDSTDDDGEGDDALSGQTADGPFVIVSFVAFAAALLGAMLLAGLFTALKRRALRTLGYDYGSPLVPGSSSVYEMPLYATVHGRAGEVPADDPGPDQVLEDSRVVLAPCARVEDADLCVVVEQQPVILSGHDDDGTPHDDTENDVCDDDLVQATPAPQQPVPLLV